MFFKLFFTFIITCITCITFIITCIIISHNPDLDFFCHGKKIEFPFWLGNGSGILRLSGTIMGLSMRPMATTSQLTQPT